MAYTHNYFKTKTFEEQSKEINKSFPKEKEQTMNVLKKDMSTKENREFWDYVHRTAEEAKSGDWQKGAVSPKRDEEVALQEEKKAVNEAVVVQETRETKTKKQRRKNAIRRSKN